MEGKNVSLPDLLRRSLLTTTQDEHGLKSVEIPDTKNFFATHIQQTTPIQIHCGVSKEQPDIITTDSIVETFHLVIYPKVLDNCSKVQLE